MRLSRGWADAMQTAGRWFYAGFFACLLAAAITPAHAESSAPEVGPLALEVADEALYLSTSLRFELPQAVEDALQKGIPVYFLFEADLVRERWYWYDSKLTHSQRTVRLAFQPLTRRWRLSAAAGSDPAGGLGLALGQSFDTMADAMASLQRVTRWKVAEASALEAGAQYSLEFRFKLDLSKLPRPFQIGALGQSDWTVAASRRQRVATDASK